jgi:hypothetical protein
MHAMSNDKIDTRLFQGHTGNLFCMLYMEVMIAEDAVGT